MFGLRGGTPAPPSACSGPSCSGREVYRYSGGGHIRSLLGHRIVSRPRRPRHLKGATSSAVEPESSERPAAEMSSMQALMELALPRCDDGGAPPDPLIRRRRGHRARSSCAGERTPAVRWTSHRFRRCTSIWTHLHHPRTRSHWMLTNVKIWR